MRSNTIQIDNQGNGFETAVAETKKAAQYQELTSKESLQLQLCAEEMLSLARSVTGEMQASFWLEAEGKSFQLNMTTKTVMDMEKRSLLLFSATSRKNEAANSFLGRLRDSFEQAMTSDSDKTYYELPKDVAADAVGYHPESQEWDRYERSVLRRMADDVKIAIRGGTVHMIVSKAF